jgi:uncharacterized protein (TIGR00730 family)
MLIQFPSHFQGMFQRVQSTYSPLLTDALRQIHEAPVPQALRPFLDHITVESSQPSFMLLPVIFLAAAEASGGITQRHIDALPTLLLSMEAIAIVDDTVDRTPMRSGRASFPKRFGDVSATPFTAALLTLIAERSKSCPAEVFDPVVRNLLRLLSMFLWERHNTYPEPARFEQWLEQRYEAAQVATQLILDGSFALNHHPPVPHAALKYFSYVFQDVDDIVSLVERRHEQGENDDLQMGVVTRPLLLTLAHTPSLIDSVEELWQHYRPLHQTSLLEFQERSAEIAQKTKPIYERLRAAIVEIGVPETARRMVGDMHRGVEATSAPLRPFMRELMLSIANRLRRCDRPDLTHILDKGLSDELWSDRAECRTPMTTPRASKTICVFSSSSDIVAPAYRDLATALGAAIGGRGDKLVFGGSTTGLMGAVAQSTHAHGGEVICVIPEMMRGTPYVFEPARETVVAQNLRTRKEIMGARADAFVVLPGGFGTLDETFEILAAKQLQVHTKPIVFLNAMGFWDPLVNLFEHLFRERFANAEHHQPLYHLAQSPEAVFAYLDAYQPPQFPIKWF